ncbi:sugar transferase [Thermohalobacter berrensis]|uniref:Bacterial sugar transferase domain-containing protein n=1 Tax=Thermohalobacter berrensis TaxID=99594 RepID=A0A419T4D4_9FIRM|nr:sugar transferase [Thermohalobacter berrensis]RKD32283.1 hypothetical protein BET03_02935 [Thermohalobacter berrensis]
MRNSKDRQIKLIFYITDILMLCVSGLIAVGIRFSFNWKEFNLPWYIFALVFIVVSTVISMYFNKLYDLKYRSWFAQVPKIINSFIYSILIFFLFSFYVRKVSYSRLALGYFSISAVILLLLGRYISIYIIKKLYQKGIGVRRLLCVGLNERSLSVLDYLSKHEEFGYFIAGYIDEENKRVKRNYPYLGRTKHYKQIIYDKRIDTVIISSGDSYVIKDIINYCEENYIQAYMIPDILDLTSNPVDIGQISTIPLVKFKEGALTPMQAKLKRLFDLCITIPAFILISPIFILIMLLIKITTKGSIFFVQERYGMNGELIRIIKFRTMIENAEEVLEELIKNDPKIREEYNTYRKLKNDPRITPIGKILRKTSLDELPQLINIIRGDLSIVGPRPMLKDEMDRYGKYGKVVLKIKPGLTGLWQVSGRNKLPFSERVRLDIYYINNWSFWLDIIIMLKTIPVLLKKEGAY